MTFLVLIVMCLYLSDPITEIEWHILSKIDIPRRTRDSSDFAVSFSTPSRDNYINIIISWGHISNLCIKYEKVLNRFREIVLLQQ